jgi:glyoxylase-like metal-dependent hydrolase (beta-lactamase superfamily II)
MIQSKKEGVMKLKRSPLIFLSLLLFLGPVFGSATDEISVDFDRVSERVLVVKSGKVYTDQIIALASKKGLVVIDTGKSPTLTEKYRKVIEQEFGRNDFAYVINTHFHFDHTSGNQIFPEAVIIAHETSPERMRQFDRERPNFVTQRRAVITQWENQLKTLEPDSEGALRLVDLIGSAEIMCDDLENNYILTLPTLTFNDRLSLDMGDLTFNLIYFGEGRHTGDDIIIHCPEEKLLFTGDLFFKGSMAIAFSSQFDAPRWMSVMNQVLKDKDAVRWVYDCHNGRMSGEFITLWRDYLVGLWNDLSTAQEEGLNLEAVQERFSYENKYSFISKSGVDPEQLKREHPNNVKYVWMRIHESQSATTLLERVMAESGLDAALKKYSEIKDAPVEKYYFDEVEMNRLGYQLINQNKLKEALEIFKMNVELYPEAWNVYDSLGEGYMLLGEKDLAIINYERSLKLNPDNANGVAMLERLKSEKR